MWRDLRWRVKELPWQSNYIYAENLGNDSSSRRLQSSKLRFRKMLINHPLEGKRYHPNMESYPLPLLGIVVCAIYWPVDLFCSQTFQLILNSMHKYQPRVHIIRKRDHTASVINLKSEEMKTFTFPETNFIGVTAYQNQLVSSKVCRPSVLKLFQLFT